MDFKFSGLAGMIGDAADNLLDELAQQIPGVMVSTALEALDYTQDERNTIFTQVRKGAPELPKGHAAQTAMDAVFVFLTDYVFQQASATVSLLLDAGTDPLVVDRAMSHFILYVHVRNGFTIIRPDGIPMPTVLTDREDLRKGL